jgi:hypothetical protein
LAISEGWEVADWESRSEFSASRTVFSIRAQNRAKGILGNDLERNFADFGAEFHQELIEPFFPCYSRNSSSKGLEKDILLLTSGN